MLTKHLALVTSMVLFTALAGQASARPAHSMTQHATHAMMSQGNVQDPEFMPDAGTSPHDMHHYTGGPKSND